MIGKWLGALVLLVCLWPGVALAQTPPAQPPPTQPAPIAPVPEKAEPAADEPRSPILYYTLAAFAAILVLLLVCVPARRE